MRTIQVFFAAARLLALLAGCSADQMPTRPVELPGAGPAGDVQTITEDAAWIGPDGGTLHVTGCVLTVPTGALAESVWITMVRHQDGSVELGPHGQTFEEPVALRFLQLSGGGAGEYRVEWFDPSGQEWVEVPSQADPSGRMAPLDHFSLYQLTPLKR